MWVQNIALILVVAELTTADGAIDAVSTGRLCKYPFNNNYMASLCKSEIHLNIVFMSLLTFSQDDVFTFVCINLFCSLKLTGQKDAPNTFIIFFIISKLVLL
jgi:hypothetical protein